MLIASSVYASVYAQEAALEDDTQVIVEDTDSIVSNNVDNAANSNQQQNTKKELPVAAVANQPELLKKGYIPFKGDVNVYGSSYSYSTGGYTSSSHSTQSCLTLLRQQNGGGFISSEDAVKKSARSQTKGGVIAGASMAAVGGTAAGLITANPLIGGAVGGSYLLITALGTEINKAKIRRNGNTLGAAEKILTGQQLSKKERKAFEKTRKKVSKKAYGDKHAIDDVDFAQTVLSQSGTGEKLFCDIDKKGRVRILAQDRNTIKRLELAQKCKDTGKIISRSRASAR